MKGTSAALAEFFPLVIYYYKVTILVILPPRVDGTPVQQYSSLITENAAIFCWKFFSIEISRLKISFMF